MAGLRGKQLFGSLVARRIFLLIAAAGLLPLMLAAFFSHFETARTLRETSYTHLREDAKAYGMEILANLQRHAGAAPGSAREAALDPDVLRRWQVDPRGRPVAPSAPGAFALPAAGIDHTHLRRGRPQLLSLPHGDATAHLLLLPPAEDTPRGSGYTVLQLDPARLWQPRAYVPFRTEYCVFTGDGLALYCTEPPGTDELATLATGATQPSAELFEWSRDGAAKLSATWALFLEPELAHESVFIVSTIDRALLYSAASVNIGLLPPLLAFVVILVALLSLRLIRRNLETLQALTKPPHDVAAGRLDRRVRVERGDEFGQLGAAFNAMAAGLAERIERLQSMAALDELVMSDASVDDICGAFLAHARRLSGADLVAACILDFDNPLNAVLHIDSADGSGRFRASAIHLSRLPRRDPDDGLAEHGMEELPRELAEVLEQRGIRRCVSVPVMLRGEIKGAVLFCAAAVARLDIVRIGRCLHLVDRLAIGVSDAEREEDLYRQAHYDELTGLPNRQLLKDRLEQAVGHALRTGTKGALLFLDLDRFKQVNDVYGHSTGDRLLVEAARRVAGIAGDAATVARLGGDEFVVMLTELDDESRADRLARKLVASLSQPFQRGDNDLLLGASIGVALFPDDGDNVESLLKNADAAMYRAKDNGRNRHEFFSRQLNEESHRRLTLERDLRRDLDSDRLQVFFQPQFGLADRELRGAEALLRWNHESLGAISPMEFVEIAEESDLIVRLGHWVIDRVCASLRVLLDAGRHPGVVAINVSARQLVDGTLAEQVRECLHRYHVNPGFIEIEVTESMLASDTGAAIDTLTALREAGVRISMDDFGTGYSSLGQLRKLPFDSLKIDRSFVMEIGRSPDAESICRAIIEMAHALGKEVVAEGIETEQQAAFLARHECEIGQGYLFAKPLPQRDFGELVARQAEHTRRRKALEVL